MINLKALSNPELLSKTRLLVSREREVTTELLWHLREVERRRLYAEEGYSSLFDYVTRGLGYCEASAARRIAAMRLLKELPDIEPALKSGELSLSNASALTHFFKSEEKCQKSYSITQKNELVKEMTGKSRRQCEALLAALAPESPRPERARPVSETHTEIRFTADQKLLAKFEKLKGLLSHQNPDASYAELFETLADMALKRLDPEQKQERKAKPATPPAESQPVNRYIPQATRREVWNRDQGKCTYVNASTGTRCESQHSLQIHHLQDFSRGGTHAPSNLTLRCRAHNLHAAIQTLGRPLMSRYLRPR